MPYWHIEACMTLCKYNYSHRPACSLTDKALVCDTKNGCSSRP